MKQKPKDDDRPHDSENVLEQKHVRGKNPVIIGAGGDVSGIYIGHVGDVYGPQVEQVQYLTEKTRRLPIHVPSIERGAFWTFVAWLLGCVADIITIVTPLGMWWRATRMPYLPWFGFLLMFICGISLLVYLRFRSLRKGNHAHFLVGWGMSEDENQKLVLEKLYAQCPCGGRIHLGRSSEGCAEQSIGRCDKNPRHSFTFDQTTRLGSYWRE